LTDGLLLCGADQFLYIRVTDSLYRMLPRHSELEICHYNYLYSYKAYFRKWWLFYFSSEEGGATATVGSEIEKKPDEGKFSLQIDNKSFYFDVQDNRRGKYLRISEVGSLI